MSTLRAMALLLNLGLAIVVVGDWQYEEELTTTALLLIPAFSNAALILWQAQRISRLERGSAP